MTPRVSRVKRIPIRMMKKPSTSCGVTRKEELSSIFLLRGCVRWLCGHQGTPDYANSGPKNQERPRLAITQAEQLEIGDQQPGADQTQPDPCASLVLVCRANELFKTGADQEERPVAPDGAKQVQVA